MLKLAVLGVRGFLLISGAVVLGLSVTLAKHQVEGSPPAETSFGSFCGAFGILVSLIGIAALFIDKIPSIVSMGADGLATALYLAGAIALTVALKPVPSCTSDDSESIYQMVINKLLNGGCGTIAGTTYCPGIPDDRSEMNGRCQRVQADYVFEYLGFIFGVAIVALTFFYNRSKGSRSVAYV
ncbi:marvel domain-containing protein [Daldinia decipiens]|uniref:marvel domain-containing protein n=1 Tax=Daldinia decipiens TaxID=326647 RepID=UPI0020C51635|nr:marvel domain-containing protein [Daldinia decipiens]KAI1659454.1 marvel domain-containing protein [Daldinia decipiens]